ncbi:MAG: 16S rRNA (cytosine(1402)-N(4))-methyltransferase RsmH [Candidatus Eisenbacteria bacterium]
MIHEPVMVAEVLGALVTDRAGRYIDGTVGEGGHAGALLTATEPSARLLGLDRDPEALRIAGRQLAPFGERVRLEQADFADLSEIAPRIGWERADGILLDLGLRSGALDEPERGFAFSLSGPLDMRFDPGRGESAADLLARIRPDALQTLFEQGTTRASPRAIARAIVAYRRGRRIARTEDLVACLRAALGRRATPKLLSSVFATLRMAVNAELADLERAMSTLPGLLKTGGVLCVLAYQSQEDRRVKALVRTSFVDARTQEPFRMVPLWPKPLGPSPAETRINRRARSAKLRALRRTPLAPSSAMDANRDT